MQGETKNKTAPNTSASQKMAKRCALRRQQMRQRLRPCLRPPSSPRKGPSLVSAGSSALYKPLYNNTVQVVGKTKANTGSTTPAPVSHPLEKLVEEYIPDSAGQVHVPYHLIAWWRDIFLYLDPSPLSRLHLRRLCNLFRDTIKAPPKGMFTMFPHPNQPSLQSLMIRCHELYDKRHVSLYLWS